MTPKTTIRISRAKDYDIQISDNQGYVIHEYNMISSDILVAVNKLICKMQQIEYRENKDVEQLEKEVVKKLNDVFGIEDGLYETNFTQHPSKNKTN